LRTLIAIAVLTALGAVAGTVWVGSRVREETVVAHPYEEGLQYDALRRARLARERGGGAAAEPEPAACELSAGPCARPLPGGGEVTLDLGPRPLRTMRTLRVNVSLRERGATMDGAQVTVSFEMSGMDMGKNETRLSPSGRGLHVGEGVLVRCRSGRRDWLATVRVRRGAGPEATASFPLRVEE